MTPAALEVSVQLSRSDFSLAAEFTVPIDGVTAIFGKSGAGKTTLLRVLAGLEPSARGTVNVGGAIWQDAETFVPAHRRAVGVVFQEAGLFSHLTVSGNLEYAAKRAGRTARREAIAEYAEVLELLEGDGLLEKPVAQLSGGQSQRVAIARALLSNPQLLLLDEPLKGLDSAASEAIMAFIESVQRRWALPVLLVSHSQDEVARLADYLVLLEAGEVTAAGPIEDMLTQTGLSLVRDERASALVKAKVKGHDDEYGLTVLGSPLGELVIPQRAVAIGQSVRVRMLARDVSLTLDQQAGTSILNIFPATVESITATDRSQCLVRLNAGGVPILSQITRRSVSALELSAGKQVFAQAKSMALLA